MWQNDNKSEICCILASLILKENNIEITENNLVTLLEKADVKFERFWPNIFLRLNKEFDISDLIGHQKKNNTDNISINNKKNEIVDDHNQKENKIEDSTPQKDSIEDDMGFGLFE